MSAAGTLHVSCAAEGDYVAHSAAMLDSVLTHAAPLAVHVHFLHSPRLSDADAGRLEQMVGAAGARIDFHSIADERVAGLPAPAQFTSAMWHRLFLPELLPGVDRVLYLDVDTLAVDALAPLWGTDLAGHHVGAVTNVFQHNHRHRPSELGLGGPEAYFNSGVLLLDLEALRRDGMTEALIDLARTRGDELEWPDQDALNLVLGPTRLALHPRWNCMNSVYAFSGSAQVFGRAARREAMRAPAVRHFEGPGENKPWHRACTHPLAERYAEHRARTPWPEVPWVGEAPPRTLRRRVGQALTAIRPV